MVTAIYTQSESGGHDLFVSIGCSIIGYVLYSIKRPEWKCKQPNPKVTVLKENTSCYDV